MKQWKKFVGYDTWDRSQVGEDSANPGPIDNKSLLAGEGCVCTIVYLHETVGCVGGGRGGSLHICTVHGIPMLQLCLLFISYHLYGFESANFLPLIVSAFLFCVSVRG